jgi:hypothetical protein
MYTPQASAPPAWGADPKMVQDAHVVVGANPVYSQPQVQYAQPMPQQMYAQPQAQQMYGQPQAHQMYAQPQVQMHVHHDAQPQPQVHVHHHGPPRSHGSIIIHDHPCGSSCGRGVKVAEKAMCGLFIFGCLVAFVAWPSTSRIAVWKPGINVTSIIFPTTTTPFVFDVSVPFGITSANFFEHDAILDVQLIYNGLDGLFDSSQCPCSLSTVRFRTACWVCLALRHSLARLLGIGSNRERGRGTSHRNPFCRKRHQRG